MNNKPNPINQTDDISLGKPVKCGMCGRKYKWTGYVEGDNTGGKDKNGWFLKFDPAKHDPNHASYYDHYIAVCPDCSIEIKD